MDEFGAATEDTDLKVVIIERIQRESGISFRDFMETAQYHPDYGYYTGGREAVGREGDFLTSPEVSPLFGAMVGRQLREMWEVMGRPGSFGAVEAGAGSGALARDITRWARRAAPSFADAMDYVAVEAAPLSSGKRSDAVRWSVSLPSGVEGWIFSNELLDAMPVHRVKVEGGKLREVFVTWDGAQFREELREPRDEVRGYFERLGLLPGEGCFAEVNTEAVEWTQTAARALNRGFVMTFDYGYEAEELYAPWRTHGTLLCFYGHNASADPYARIGKQDITSHVDFTTLRRAGEEAGLQTAGLVTQSEFLANLGVGEALAMGEEPKVEEYFARRRAVLHLLDPGGLGRIKVLVQSKGVGAVTLTGLAANADKDVPAG